MQSRREDILEEQNAKKFCFKHGKNATETYEMLQNVFGAFCMDHTSVFFFKSGLRHFHQDNARVYRSIVVTDYLTKMGINTVLQPPSSANLAPCHFWLFLSSEAVVIG